MAQVYAAFGSLCAPAKIVAVLNLIEILLKVIATKGDLRVKNVMSITASILAGLILVIILNSLCSTGYTPLSWFLIVLSLFSLVVAPFTISSESDGPDQNGVAVFGDAPNVSGVVMLGDEEAPFGPIAPVGGNANARLLPVPSCRE